MLTRLYRLADVPSSSRRQKKSGIMSDTNVLAANRGKSKAETKRFTTLEIAHVLARLDHVARFIVNADHSVM